MISPPRLGVAQPQAAQPAPQPQQHETDHDYTTGDGSSFRGGNYFSLL